MKGGGSMAKAQEFFGGCGGVGFFGIAFVLFLILILLVVGFDN
jgi:hypothetical protein